MVADVLILIGAVVCVAVFGWLWVAALSNQSEQDSNYFNHYDDWEDMV